jgi:hypothetical protein
MARKRVIYQSESLFVAPTGNWTGATTAAVPALGGSAGSPTVPGSGVQVHRVQSINYGFDIPRQDVNEFGKLARIDQVILESPTVSLDFTYYPETGVNERSMGLVLSPVGASSAVGQVSALSGFLNGNTDVKSYFIRTVSEGSDEILKGATDTSTESSIIAIGNASITSYSFEASVGGFPTSSVNAEGLNINILAEPGAINAVGNKAATVNTETGAQTNDEFALETSTTGMTGASLTGNQLTAAIPSALRPGDVVFTDMLASAAGSDGKLLKAWDVSALKIQSVSASLDLGREDLMKLGSKFAFSKEVQYPVTVSMSIEATVSDMQDFDLSDLIAADSSVWTAGFKILRPDSADSPKKQAVAVYIKGAKLDSEALSSSIGDNKSVTFSFTSQVGGPQDTTAGIFIQGGEADD